jgi:hypothetical protein
MLATREGSMRGSQKVRFEQSEKVGKEWIFRVWFLDGFYFFISLLLPHHRVWFHITYLDYSVFTFHITCLTGRYFPSLCWDFEGHLPCLLIVIRFGERVLHTCRYRNKQFKYSEKPGSRHLKDMIEINKISGEINKTVGEISRRFMEEKNQ